jgi:EAL and modified HD-GYP domain-containing signal transduction protein
MTRKPLLDRNKSIFGYEVSFRDTNGLSPDLAPVSSPGDALALFLGMNRFGQLAGDRMALVRLGPDLVKDDIVTLLPADKGVLDISDGDTHPDLVERCKTLRQQGYKFCLSNFRHDGAFSPFLQLAEFVQIPVSGEDRSAVAENMSLVRKLPAKIIASGVHTAEDYEYCSGLGFDLLKGSFYYRPSALAPKSVSPSQLLLLELAAHLARDDDMHLVERIFKKNPDLTFGILKLINSAFFRVQQRVTSVRQAIALLGYENLQKWVALLLFTVDHRDHAHNPLVEKALVRGRMMEMLAERVTGSKTVADSAFITGILSFAHVLFGVKPDEFLEKLNLAIEINEALLLRQGVLGTLLAITEHLDDEDYEAVEEKLPTVRLRSVDLFSIETKATVEYQTSLTDDQRKGPQGKEAR